MHKTIRSLTLIALLCTVAPAQAQLSGAQLAAKGVIKLLFGSSCGLISLQLAGGAGYYAAGGLALGRPEVLAFSLLPGAGSAGLGAASFFLIRSGWRDLNASPGNSKKKKTKDKDDADD